VPVPLTVIFGRSLTMLLFIGDAAIILPLSIVKLYSVPLSSVAVSPGEYPFPELRIYAPVTAFSSSTSTG